ncbi:magnesium transporter CorA family protein [Pseudomonas fluorescens]|uniref:Putative Mg2+ transporter protein, CorA-like protein n=1 Tax=Pseudomonas fluorescens (strain Pf0-1) TaxID=205922 RepID=Q3KCZ6_PSEPF|nr:magnesium transporter CorA family protein [Pseudomonas fluorescens]ABA74359.1 putative Mg2+ transporter protein, CorA-like protein [Pseudomonas fluorescens Pf0-1]MBY9025983.1 magnesium transporter CorA family protein [Pseudomonas fluorescens]MBY9031211.1 magnesium transporter CorA family protein [Pseudomonas fluorescens]MBY9037801.1 magnesium transporter CorA family protein [Pseudomonas fluorescens]MBY9041394.1 magnesium transporter CorA family protein [Pseudomonas fluorescens]
MINSFALNHGGLQRVERLDAEVMLFSDPDTAERDLLHSHFKLDEHALASALDPDEVSRIEFHPDHLFLIWKRPENYSGGGSLAFEVSSCGLLFSPGQLLVIATDDTPLHGVGTRQPLNTPLDVLLDLLFNNIHHYLGHLKVIKLVARELQQKFNASMQNQHLVQMFNLSESLIYYINALHSNGAVLTRLRNHAEKQHFGSEAIGLIDDLIIENNQCYKQAEIYSTVFSGLIDARGNLMNNSMNNLLRKLTLINVVFLPLNLIASIGGMSEFSMMTAGTPWWVSYPLFLAAMLLGAGGMLFGLRRLAK